MVNAQQFGKNADVNDVRDQLGDFGVDLAGQRAHRYRIGNDVLPVDGLLLGVAVPNHDRSGLEGSEVVFPRGRIHEHLNVGAVSGRLVSFVGEADNVPRWQSRNVRRKEVFSADGNAHVKERLKENQVGRLRPGSVGGGDVDGEVVDDAVHVKHPSWGWRISRPCGWVPCAPFQHVANAFRKSVCSGPFRGYYSSLKSHHSGALSSYDSS